MRVLTALGVDGLRADEGTGSGRSHIEAFSRELAEIARKTSSVCGAGGLEQLACVRSFAPVLPIVRLLALS